MLFPVAKNLISRLDYPDPLRVQKLVYIIFGFYAAKYDKYLFEDKIEAWTYGPVIPRLYAEMKYPSSNGFDLAHVEEVTAKEVLEVIDTVVSIYGKKSASYLVEFTHAAGTPWSNVYDGTKSKEIPKELIKDYYRRVLNAKALIESYKSVFEALSKT